MHTSRFKKVQLILLCVEFVLDLRYLMVLGILYFFLKSLAHKCYHMVNISILYFYLI